MPENDKKHKIDKNLRNHWWSFKGRLGRKDFSIRFFSAIIVIVISIYFEVSKYIYGGLYTILLPSIYFLIVQTVKRVHDINKSGHQISHIFSSTFIAYLFSLVTVPKNEIPIMPLILIPSVFLFASALVFIPVLFKKGTIGPNRYGDEPKK
ncbi:MAG: hypothetical protein CR982_10255 [Candidatus Cloacimonadota bacterium]|nr:MAG: hypothetical protein CR982_10255 [Candidatus Cloacimonadota bacterium]PIE77544.1 MAG: hypothetical protein CSA15_12270 [Candidatus Delongbacteria bacterium]